MTSPWEEYRKKANLKTFTLEQFGMKEMWFKVRDPGYLTPEEIEALSEQHFETYEKAVEQLTVDYEKTKKINRQKLREIRRAVLTEYDCKFLVEWNLTDPETNEPLKLPSEDFGSLSRIPIEILYFIKEKMLEVFEGVVPPKVRGTISGLYSAGL